MKKIFFDTSILSRIAWSEKNTSIITDNWDLFLNQMDAIYPGFSEEDFTWITSSALYLEIIGLGKVRKEYSKHSVFKEKQFKPLKNLAINDEYKQFPITELFTQEIISRIDTFIKNELSPRNLYRQTLKFLRTYPSHPHSHFIVANIKRWSKNIKREQQHYQHFRKNILWDSIFRYPFINIQKVAVKNIKTTIATDQLPAMEFWAEIMGILYRQYHEEYIKNISLECSSLGLFAEIDRIGSAHNGIASQRGYDDILRQWDDMVDADSIHYALIGKRITLKINEPVIVVTGDKIEDIKQRLECLYKNLQEMAAQGKKIDICPGTIICFSPETMKYHDTINVQTFITKFIYDLNKTQILLPPPQSPQQHERPQ